MDKVLVTTPPILPAVEAPSKDPPIYDVVPIPPTGVVSGMAGPFIEALNGETFVKNMKRAFSSKSLEGRILIIQQIIAYPLKLVLAVISIIKNLAVVSKAFATLIAGCTAITVVLLGPVFLAISAIYLALEFTKSIMVVVKSHNFEKKENINGTLKKLEHNSNTAYKARIIQKKIAELSDHYRIGEKNRTYFSRRIGGNAAQAFFKASKNIHLYTEDTLKKMNSSELMHFNKQGAELLNLVDTQRSKVEKIHLFAIAVLAISTASLIVSSTLLPISIPALSLSIAVLSSATSLARGYANEAYVDNAREGFDIKLAIPKVLCPKDGEKTGHLWRTASKVGKVFYAVGCGITAGLLPLFDHLIYKSEWIKKLRGKSDQFDHPKAKFKVQNYTIAPPPDLKTKPQLHTRRIIPIMHYKKVPKTDPIFFFMKKHLHIAW